MKSILLMVTMLLAGCSSPSPEMDSKLRTDCVRVAKEKIGAMAELIEFGSLSPRSPTECVAVDRINEMSDPKKLFVRRLVILRRVANGWTVALDVAKDITNPEGFVGIDYIDDAFKFEGYRVDLARQGFNGASRFTIAVTYLVNGKEDGVPIEIGWNPETGRYQEFGYSTADAFKQELKNPPHIRVCRSCGRGDGAETKSPK